MGTKKRIKAALNTQKQIKAHTDWALNYWHLREAAEFSRLIDESSLGTPAARQLSNRVQSEQMARMNRLLADQGVYGGEDNGATDLKNEFIDAEVHVPEGKTDAAAAVSNFKVVISTFKRTPTVASKPKTIAGRQKRTTPAPNPAAGPKTKAIFSGKGKTAIPKGPKSKTILGGKGKIAIPNASTGPKPKVILADRAGPTNAVLIHVTNQVLAPVERVKPSIEHFSVEVKGNRVKITAHGRDGAVVGAGAGIGRSWQSALRSARVDLLKRMYKGKS